MTPTAETSAPAALIVDTAADQAITDALRERLAERAAGLKLDGVRPRWHRLNAIPPTPRATTWPPTAPTPQLLHVTRGDVRGTPFASTDHETIRWFAEQVNRAFLPRPQRALPAIAVGNRHPEISLPAAFEAFRLILKKTGVNMASTVQLSATREMTTDEAIAARDGENPTAAGHTRVSIRHLYHAGLWAAIRAGWREGYNAEADHFIVTGANAGARSRARWRRPRKPSATPRAIPSSPPILRGSSFWKPTRAIRRHGAMPQVEEKFEAAVFSGRAGLDPGRVLKRVSGSEEHVYQFNRGEVLRLAVKFGESLKLNEDLFDSIRRERNPARRSISSRPSTKPRR